MDTHYCTKRGGNLKIRPACCLGLVGSVLILSLAWGFLLRPSTSATPTKRRVPKGQYKADARTLMAALRYFMETDSDDQWRRAATLGGPGPVAAQAPGQQSNRSASDWLVRAFPEVCHPATLGHADLGCVPRLQGSSANDKNHAAMSLARTPRQFLQFRLAPAWLVRIPKAPRS